MSLLKLKNIKWLIIINNKEFFNQTLNIHTFRVPSLLYSYTKKQFRKQKQYIKYKNINIKHIEITKYNTNHFRYKHTIRNT